MKHHTLEPIRKDIEVNRNLKQSESFSLYPCIELYYFHLQTEKVNLCHDTANDNILEINYCRSGRIGRQTEDGNMVYLGAGDYSVSKLKVNTDCVMTLPNGDYDGITLYVDLEWLSENPPELLQNAGIDGKQLYNKFCKSGAFLSFPGTPETDEIFSGFYNKSGDLQAAYRKLKAIEILLFLSQSNVSHENQLTQYQSEQVAVIRSVHDYLVGHLDERLTIEALAKQYLINTTTLKNMFKAVYGDSIASHIKAHRMELAARLLMTTQDSIAEIAAKVGYDSQSKFSASFKEYYNVLPSKYRK